MQPVEITRAQWEQTPASVKRTHKDGTRVIKCRRGPTVYWQPVFWKR